MDEYYEYCGYIITETEDGYFAVDDCEFPTYDDACDYIDSLLGYPTVYDGSSLVPELHLYHIFYVTKSMDRGYDDYISAYSEDDAIVELKRKHRDIAYIADIYVVDED